MKHLKQNKRSRHAGRASSKLDADSAKIQLALPLQQNKRLLRDIKPFEVSQ